MATRKKTQTVEVEVDPRPMEDEWLDELRGTSPPENTLIGTEITVRLVIAGEDDYEMVNEILDHARQYGAAEITSQIPLRRNPNRGR